MRLAQIATLILGITGCAPTSWDSVKPEMPFADGKAPHLARLILTSGDTLMAYRPTLVADTVVWMAEPSGAPIQNLPMEIRKRFTVPLTRVREIQLPAVGGDEAGNGAGIALAVGGALLFVVGMWALATHGTGPHW